MSQTTDATAVTPFGAPGTWNFLPGHAVTASLRAIARLGGGRRCETWLCWSTEWLCPVAVKMGRPGTAADPRTARRLAAEAERVASLAHPSFQRVVATHVDGDVPHVVFEYVEGPSLRSLLDRGGAFAPVDVAVIGEQIAWALEYLHRRGLAHLDLKPQNILLRDGRPVIADLGLARPLGTEPHDRLRGTVGYHAPEQLAGCAASAAMDLYTFGVVLHELLFAVRPGSHMAIRESSVGRIDALLRLLLGPPGYRPSAHRAASELGAIASLLGDEPFCPPPPCG